MPNIKRPMGFDELNLKPPITGEVRLSEDMQQTLALLTAYGDNKRVLVKATEAGVLNITSPQIQDIIAVVAGSTPELWQGSDIPCTEIAVIASPSNTGRIWVRPYSAASVANAWPLDKGDVFGFTISNLNQLHIKFELEDDLAAIAYTR